MREIKFRAWDDKNTKWTTLISAYTNEDQTVTLNIKENKDLIVEQYTGLKDKNGKEIYEGDILATFSDGIDPDGGYCDEWEKEILPYQPVSIHARFTSGLPDEEYNSIYNKRFVEIIGNIHEQNNLLD